MGDKVPFAVRHEYHFGDRLVRCYATRPANLLASFRRAVSRAPDNECLVCDGQRLTYREANRRIQHIAAQLARRGVEAGDRIALLMANSNEFVLALLGALRLGAIIVVPVNIRESKSGLAYILYHCQAKVLIHDEVQSDKVSGRETLPALAFRFAVGDEVAGAEPFEALLKEGAPRLPLPTPQEDDTAILLYTSGTTGRPKGVRLTHLNLLHSLLHFEQSMALGENERSLLVVPASHVTGVVAVILTLFHVGGCVVIQREFDAQRFLALADRERITHTVMVPAMYNLCLLRADFGQYDLSAWRLGGFGGAPMPEATIERLAERLPNLQLVNAYGATETCSPATILPLGEAARHADSVGRVVTCGDIKVMDSNGRERPPGEAGELWIAGPMVTPGYWNNAEADRAEFAGGYWRSGDIGSVDENGYVRVLDRKKDMINRAGYNIYSAELEGLLQGLDGVIECAAVARPDPVLGEKIQLFVVSDDPGLSAARLKTYCAEHLADYKIPDFIDFLEEPLPRNANGKVLKAQLRLRISETQTASG